MAAWASGALAGPLRAEEEGVDFVEKMEQERAAAREKSNAEDLEALKGPDAEKASSALYRLGKSGDPALIPEVSRRLKDARPTLRSLAAVALGNLEAAALADDIAPLLKDPDQDVRQSAASALGKLGARRHAPDIARLLRDPQWSVRAAAMYALADLGESRYSEDIARTFSDEGLTCGQVQAAAHALGRFGARQHAPQLARIMRESPNCGRYMTQSLASMGDKSHAPAIAHFLKTGADDGTKADAALALAELGVDDHVLETVGLLGTHFSEKAALALGLLKQTRHAARIAESLGGYSSGGAAQALALMGAGEHAAKIAALLRKSDYNHYCSAIWALGRLKAAEHADLLAAYLKYKGTCFLYDLDSHRSEERRVDALAREALQRMGLPPNAAAQ